MLVELSDQDLLNRLTNFEDHFVERKTIADQKDWVKTVVAFANSAPIGFPCVLFIGAKNDGEIETPQADLDSAQKTLNNKLKSVYPRPPYIPKVVAKAGRQVLAVTVLGSELRPHFSGPAYIRQGSESLAASKEQFNELIAQRNSKASKILEYKGTVVTVINRQQTSYGGHLSAWPDNIIVIECNQFWVTLENQGDRSRQSVPLSRVDLNFDHKRDRLNLEIRF